MANTIKVTTKYEYQIDGTTVITKPSTTKDVTTSSSLIYGPAAQLVGTTQEVLAIGDLTDDVYCEIENKHASAIVSVGNVVSATYYPVIDIPAGEKAILPRLSTAADVYLKSDTASTPVYVTLAKVS